MPSMRIKLVNYMAYSRANISELLLEHGEQTGSKLLRSCMSVDRPSGIKLPSELGTTRDQVTVCLSVLEGSASGREKE